MGFWITVNGVAEAEEVWYHALGGASAFPVCVLHSWLSHNCIMV